MTVKEGTLTFCGKHVSQSEDGTISIGQVETAKNIEPFIIQKARLKDPEQPLLAHELCEFRRAIGQMSCLSRQSRPDLAAYTYMAAQITGDPCLKHVVIAYAKEEAEWQW
ncbi:MAG: hypothetical protein ACKPKO_14670, partial [Candidatus Fonsibacter sp.]